MLTKIPTGGTWQGQQSLVRCGHTLVKLSKSHANPHGMLQELLSTAADA